MARQVSVSTGHMDEWRPREPERRAAGQRPCSACLAELAGIFDHGDAASPSAADTFVLALFSGYARVDQNDQRAPPFNRRWPNEKGPSLLHNRCIRSVGRSSKRADESSSFTLYFLLLCSL